MAVTSRPSASQMATKANGQRVGRREPSLDFDESTPTTEVFRVNVRLVLAHGRR